MFLKYVTCTDKNIVSAQTERNQQFFEERERIVYVFDAVYPLRRAILF